jgi:hypothetical protein
MAIEEAEVKLQERRLNIRDRHGAGAYIQNVSLLAPFFETYRLL